MTISRKFYEQCCKTPGKVAIIQGERQITYAGVLEEVQRQAHIFRVNDLKRGEHLGTQLEGIDFVIALLAAADCGLCLVPLPTRVPPDTLAAALNTTHCVAYINAPMEPRESAFGTRLKFEGRDDDLFLMITTSGSTGSPKPIMLKQKTKLRRVESFIETYGITEKDTVLISTPLCHSMGMRLALVTLLQGGTMVLMEHWDVTEWRDMATLYQATYAVPVAAQVHQIVKEEPDVMPSMRFLVSSSAPLWPAAREALSCPVYDCYGTTEIAIATDGRVHAQGNPVNGASVKIVERGEVVGGEIAVKTEMLFDGYYEQSALTEKSMTEDGYFLTGDAGYFDLSGALVYTGRFKELVNVGGVKVYPQDVENVISRHYEVKECAVFALPDYMFGEVVAVAVVSRDGRLLTDEELWGVQAFCLIYLNDAQLPRKLFAVTELPRTETGKIQRLKLQEQFK